jgi:hypothetical protein
MRSDMAKVIVERPRGGWIRKSRQKGYRRYVQQSGDAGLPVRECMLGQWRGGTKHFSEHLGPLRRYLRSQVGRPWNSVHSEICQHVRPDSVVQQHILTHVWGYVAFEVIIRDGVPCSGAARRFGRPLEPGDLYVCPQTGFLRTARAPRRKQIRRHFSADATVQYHLVLGVWHEVRLQNLPPDFEECWDALLKRRIDTSQRAVLQKTYGMAAYALSARELSKREVKVIFRECR